jgi:hypothetical protein
MDKAKEEIKKAFESASDKMAFLNELNEYIHREISEVKQPINFVRWIPVEKVHPNDYNPNSVAKIEMGLLYKSIKHDGYTQPIVTIYDQEADQYVIVDGFHRYFTCKTNKDIYERNKGYLPCVVIEKDINERMAATVRHNRARGEHSVAGMGNMVFEMLENGWSESEICNHLGMEPEEILKLKHITGFSRLFENVNYQKSWETKNQIKLKKEYKDSVQH